MAMFGNLAVSTLEGRVGVYATAIDAGVETEELLETASALATKYPVIPNYSSLSRTDQTWWDVAVGTLTAIRLIGQLYTVATGGVQQTKEGDVTTVLLALPSADEQTKWQQEALEALRFISAYRAALARSAKRYDMFVVTGRTRGPLGLEFPEIDIGFLLPPSWGLLTGSIFGVDDAGLEIVDFGRGTFYP